MIRHELDRTAGLNRIVTGWAQIGADNDLDAIPASLSPMQRGPCVASRPFSVMRGCEIRKAASGVTTASRAVKRAQIQSDINSTITILI